MNWQKCSLLLYLIIVMVCPDVTYADFSQVYNQYNSISNFTPSNVYNMKLSVLSAAVSDDAYQDKSYDITLQNAGFSNINLVNIGTDLQAMTATKQFPDEGKRVIAIVFRGTSTLADAMTDLNVARDVFNPDAPKIEVHHGFMLSTQYFLAYEPNILIDSVKSLDQIIAEKNPNDIFWISGHSLGGAIATLYTAKLKDRGINPANIITYTFGAPAVGNDDFATPFDNQLNLHRVRNLYDPVPYAVYIATLNPYNSYKQIGYQRIYDGKVDVTALSITPTLPELLVSLPDHSMSVYKTNLAWITNNSLGTATNIQDSVAIHDAITSSEINKYYTFTLPTASNVTISTKPQTSSGSGLPWSVFLYNEANTNLLNYTFNPSSPNGDTQQVGLPAGTYYIKINTAYSSLYGVPYNLTVSATGGAIYEQEPNDSLVTATPITFNTPYTANIQDRSSGTDVDYYKFRGCKKVCVNGH